MIIINLMPEELRRKKRTPLPHLLSLLALALTLAGVAMLYLAKQSEVSAVQAEIDKLDAQFAQLQPVAKEHATLTEAQGQLVDRVIAIKEIIADRVIWSERLARLAKLTPNDYWYTRLWITQKDYPVTKQKVSTETGQPEVDKEGKPVMETVKEKRDVLVVEGTMLKGSKNMQSPYEFAQKTKTDPEFSKVFKLDDVNLTGSTIPGTGNFTLWYRIAKSEEQ